MKFVLEQNIDIINYLVDYYFSSYPNETIVDPKKLAMFACNNGIRISANTIRRTLNELDKNDVLNNIPHIHPQTNYRNTNWLFDKNRLYQGIP